MSDPTGSPDLPPRLERRRAPSTYAPDFLMQLLRNPLEPGYAEAAQRRRTGPPAPAWRGRAARALRLLVLALTGFLLAVAYRHAVAATPQASSARAGLVADVQARRGETDELQRQADRLREQVAAERDAALGGSGGEADRLRTLEAGTGLARVHGDGVVVRLADAPPPIDPVTGKPSATNPGVVLDRDLQDVVNELWRDGAEAIAINGQRLTATSPIRAAGGAILVDFRPVTGPYQVAAIGPDSITRRFTDSATARRFRRYVDTYRMGFTVRAQEAMTLPAAGEPQLRYARAPGGSPSATPGPPTPSTSGGS
jgi:uncharacterized protein YlxW (UPF0749 family)